jgi:cytochrome c oxidase cbb3-type subunit 3
MRIFVLLAAAMVALGGCSRSAPPSNSEGTMTKDQMAAADSAATKEDLELGRRIYNFRCYYCHGYSGNAHTLAATLLSPKPVDFTSISPDTLSRERMLLSIQNGRPGTAMMGFASVLKPNEIEAVTDFVRQEFMV